MGVRTMLEAVPLCQLNGSEAERMLDDLTRMKLPARMRQPPPQQPPLPPAKPVGDPVQLRIEQLMASLDIEGAAMPAVAVAHAEPLPKPSALPASVLRPPSVAVSALSQAPTAAAALRQPPVPVRAPVPAPAPAQPRCSARSHGRGIAPAPVRSACVDTSTIISSYAVVLYTPPNMAAVGRQ